MSVSLHSPLVSTSPVGRLAPYLPAVFYLSASLAMVFLWGDDWIRPLIEDDSYYYLVIARTIFETGRSEFTPGILTNGYHPLWMGVLIFAGGLFGFTIATVKAVEIVAVFVGMAALIRLFRVRRVSTALAVTLLFWYVVRSFALNGMETTLLVPLLVLFTALVLGEDAASPQRRPLLLFLAAAAVLGTRIDSAVFVLPMLAVAPIPTGSKLRVFAGLALCGAVYGAINLWIFGIAVPISGAVKSLGGLQFNTRYVENNLLSNLTPAGILKLQSGLVSFLAAIAAAVILALFPRSDRGQAKRVLVAAILGLALYEAKLLFGSSWRVWAWYNFPTLIFALIGLFVLSRVVADSRLRLLRLGEVAIGVVLTAFFVLSSAGERSAGFIELNRRFVEDHSDLLGGAPVAMGDRAGSFAYAYRGGVYQLEGLVNDRRYLEVLKAGGDLRQHLCAQGVRHFVDYEPDLGAYESRRIEIFRPLLTTFAGPTLTVHRGEQRFVFADETLFAAASEPDGDNRLYLWRLDCPSSENSNGDGGTP